MRRTFSMLMAFGVAAVAGFLIGTPTAYAGIGWIVLCPWSHSLSDDPIVFPNQPGASHLHDFFGNISVHADSTDASMRSSETLCVGEDTAGYWVPAVLMNGVRIKPNAAPPNGTRSKTRQQFYYRAGAGVNAPETIEPFPSGLRVIAGNGRAKSAAENPKLGREIYWGCSDNSTTGKREDPPNCKTGIVSLHVGFPSCWNGKDLDSADHQSHMAYPSSGKCPTSHPVAVPRLIMRYEYPVGTSSVGLTLASGPPYTAHGDFWNTWNQVALEQLVRDCLNAEVDCGKFEGQTPNNDPTPDNEPPSQPQNLSSPSQTATTIALTWDASTDNVGVVQYNVDRDGSLVASVGGTSFSDRSLNPSRLYDYEVSAVDAAGLESLLSDVLTVKTQDASEPPGPEQPGTISRQVSASEDDAEENLSNGSVILSSSDLELIRDRDRHQAVGIRFQDVDVPKDATIEEAYIQFTVDEAKSDMTSLEIYGQASGDALAFTTAIHNITNRPTTDQVINWNPEAWNQVGASGVAQRTPDLRRVVQEIVDGGGWRAGNAMVFIIKGVGVRTAEAFDGKASASPILTVTYSDNNR